MRTPDRTALENAEGSDLQLIAEETWEAALESPTLSEEGKRILRENPPAPPVVVQGIIRTIRTGVSEEYELQTFNPGYLIAKGPTVIDIAREAHRIYSQSLGKRRRNYIYANRKITPLNDQRRMKQQLHMPEFLEVLKKEQQQIEEYEKEDMRRRQEEERKKEEIKACFEQAPYQVCRKDLYNLLFDIRSQENTVFDFDGQMPSIESAEGSALHWVQRALLLPQMIFRKIRRKKEDPYRIGMEENLSMEERHREKKPLM